ncbi:MAG: hypothetical protein A4E55_01607 [Pelotomaculum sp. PtaU1.Bin035]|nr:MAG: hypothetical protein A4E55_01607 [Pelotomaculum sp. PtaU1.Bin035]
MILPGKQRVQWEKREAIVRIGTAKRWEPPAPKIGGGGWGLGVEGPRRPARTGPQSWAVWPGWLTYEAKPLRPARAVCPTSSAGKTAGLNRPSEPGIKVVRAGVSRPVPSSNHRAEPSALDWLSLTPTIKCQARVGG